MIDERRRVENFALVCPLKDIADSDMLAFLATLIQDDDHLREKLMSEPDHRERSAKLEAMRPYLRFKAKALHVYEMAEVAKSVGVQPMYQEQADMEQKRIYMPQSQLHEISE